MSEYSAKVHRNPGGDVLVIEAGGTVEFQEGAAVTGLTGAAALATASEAVLGGVKAAAKGAGDTVEAKVGADAKLYVPASPAAYTLPAATATVLGGIMAAEIGDNDVVEVKVDPEDNRLYVPKYMKIPGQAAAAADATLEVLRAKYIQLIEIFKSYGFMDDQAL